MQLSSTIVSKRKKELLRIPLDFGNGLTKDAFVDSRVHVRAIAHIELDRIKQQDPANILKIDDPTIFETQLASGQLEKPLSTTTLKFYFADHKFEEHFFVMENLIGPITGLHVMRKKSIIIDTTH